MKISKVIEIEEKVALPLEKVFELRLEVPEKEIPKRLEVKEIRFGKPLYKVSYRIDRIEATELGTFKKVIYSGRIKEHP